MPNYLNKPALFQPLGEVGDDLAEAGEFGIEIRDAGVGAVADALDGYELDVQLFADRGDGVGFHLHTVEILMEPVDFLLAEILHSYKIVGRGATDARGDGEGVERERDADEWVADICEGVGQHYLALAELSAACSAQGHDYGAVTRSEALVVVENVAHDCACRAALADTRIDDGGLDIRIVDFVLHRDEIHLVGLAQKFQVLGIHKNCLTDCKDSEFWLFATILVTLLRLFDIKTSYEIL